MEDWEYLPFDVPEARRQQPVTPQAPLSVSDLTRRLKQAIEGEFGLITVEGEVSNYHPASSGHIYFTLKDDYAQIRAALYRTQARQQKFTIENGQHVVARGRLSVYEARGEYQLIVESVEPHGLGALQAAFEQLKRKLHAEGLFDAARKRPLPVLPRRIGVVTSIDGAALRDILRVIGQRHAQARIVVRSARVQGDEAPGDLVRALRAIVKVEEIDVVIIGRGGGSVEDLWAFNDERVARAIAACPVPVISAVGHEVDFTIADFVADVRAATPSNAAELVIDKADNFSKRIDHASARLARVMEMRIALRERDHESLDGRLARAIGGRLVRASQTFEALRRRLERRDVRRVIGDLRTRLVQAHHQLRSRVTDRRHDAERRTATLAARLDALSPLAVLGRGYALCWNDARTGIIRSSVQVKPGDRVQVTLAEGELGCRVEDTRPPR